MIFALYLVLVLFENTYEPIIFVAAFYTILEQAIIVAIVMLFSSFSVSTFLPGFLTVAFYIVGHSLSILKYFLVEDTNRVLYWTIYLIYICLPYFGVFNHNQEIVYNLPMSIDNLYKSIVYTVFYCFSLLLISMRLFRFRDL